MAGRVPEQKLIRQREAPVRRGGARVDDAAAAEQFDHLGIVRAEGVAHADDRRPAELLELPAVVEHFGEHRGGGDPFKIGMVRAVTAHLVSGIEIGDLLRLNPVPGAQQRGVEVEGPPDAVAVEDGDEPAVLAYTVVVAHGERLRTALRIEIFENHDSFSG